MDTNVKKSNRPLWLKLTCLILTILLFAVVAGSVWQMCTEYGYFEEWLFYTYEEKQGLSYTDTSRFRSVLFDDLLVLSMKTGTYWEEMVRQDFADQYDELLSDFLRQYQYAKVVEGSQWGEYQISFGNNYFSYSSAIEYTTDLADPTAFFKERFDALVASLDPSDYAYEESISPSVKYYITDPQSGTVFTNVQGSREELLAYLGEQDVFFTVVNGKLSQMGLDNAEKYGLLDEGFAKGLDVYVVIDTEGQNDIYARLESRLEDFKAGGFEDTAALLIISGLGCILLFVLLLVFTQRRKVWVDKIPLEIHLAVSAVAAVFLIWFAAETLSVILNGYGYYESYRSVMQLLFVLAAMAGWAVICEFCCSLTRICKSGELLYSFLVCRIVRYVYREVKRFATTVLDVFSYEPGTMRRYIFPMLTAWIGLSILFGIGACQHFVFFVLFVVLQFVIAYHFASYLSQLDKIIQCAEKRTEYTGDVAALPGSLRALLQSQQITQSELAQAVEKAIRDERTKAELITNVSHDLKTPLTSVINYIDLLKNCDISDETALEYLSVLTDKSAKLKRLIEDLIEASKVTTGNITLNKSELSLCELVNQAIVEEGDEFEKRGLTLVFNTTAAPTVFADGSSIYRVMENLLSNAGKYSLTGSRIYATVYEEEKYGCFEIKNTSREALDIPPKELTERFVRGDRSRGEEGNGLGLSIADNLCRLNGGQLVLSIDGDLFKATVKLPKV